MNTLQIGLDAWIIQDGNYPDFFVNQEVSFALEFHPHSLRPSSDGLRSFTLTDHALYSVHGSIDFIHKETWVIDIGILAYADGAIPEEFCSPRWIDGELYLSVDPFFYFESLKNLPGIPALTYRWRIQNIKLETTPWIKTERHWTRDSNKTSFRDVSKTDAWNDDEGHAHYLLESECLGSAHN